MMLTWTLIRKPLSKKSFDLLYFWILSWLTQITFLMDILVPFLTFLQRLCFELLFFRWERNFLRDWWTEYLMAPLLNCWFLVRLMVRECLRFFSWTMERFLSSLTFFNLTSGLLLIYNMNQWAIIFGALLLASADSALSDVLFAWYHALIWVVFFDNENITFDRRQSFRRWSGIPELMSGITKAIFPKKFIHFAEISLYYKNLTFKLIKYILL